MATAWIKTWSMAYGNSIFLLLSDDLVVKDILFGVDWRFYCRTQDRRECSNTPGSILLIPHKIALLYSAGYEFC